MSRPWRQEIVDPHYIRFHTSVRDEETLAHMVAPVIARFAKEGLRTAIVTEKEDEHYLIHCVAVRLLKGEIPRAVSQCVGDKVLDGISVSPMHRSDMEPLGISFGLPRF
ncbi:MAG: hypothetical protein ACAI44_16245 [Candidatus Sericytochromatia bacterium]